MKYTFITGARRNPEQNVREDRNQEITNYYELDKQNKLPIYFVSFTSLPKIGINPDNKYDTPIGIYTYPLRYMYKDIISDTLPFAGNRKYIQVLQLETKKVLWGTRYTASKYEKDTKKLESIWNKERHKMTFDHLQFAQSQLGKYIDNIESAADFFTFGDGDYEEYEYDTEEDYLDSCLDNLTFHDIRLVARLLAESSAKLNNSQEKPVRLIWGLTQTLAMLLFTGPSFTTKWNWLFRQIGYEVIVDRGLGFIHPHETTQALFLSKNGFKHIATIDNKKSSNKIQDTRPDYLKKFGDITERQYKEYVQQNPSIKNIKCRCHLLFDNKFRKIKIYSPSNTIKKTDLNNFVLFISCENCKIVDCNIIGGTGSLSSLKGIHIYFSMIEKCTLDQVNIERCQIYKSDLRDVMIEHSNIFDSTVSSEIEKYQVSNCEFKNCTITGEWIFDTIKFNNCTIKNKSKCDFINCTFE